jgi:atypical dual specificity phosphatase
MNGFSWVVEGEIGGMARPPRDAHALWRWLADRNVRLVVSLTSGAPDPGELAAAGLDGVHIPIPDFTPPTPEDIDEFLSHARFCRHEGKAVVVHCGAGIGRTGTMIACWLVDQGMAPQKAVATVRRARPGSIETAEQEQAIRDFAARREG